MGPYWGLFHTYGRPNDYFNYWARIYNILCTAFSLGQQRHVISDYKVPTMKDALGNVLLILSAFILRIQFGSAAYRNIFLDAYHFRIEILFGTQLINLHINFNRCIDRQVGLTEGKIWILGSTPDKPVIKELKSIKYNYSGPTMDTSNRKVDFYAEIIRHKVAFSKHVDLST